jgi:hypothetical protein
MAHSARYKDGCCAEPLNIIKCEMCDVWLRYTFYDYEDDDDDADGVSCVCEQFSLVSYRIQ